MKIHNIQLNKVFPDGFIPCSLTDLMKIKTKRAVAREKVIKPQKTFYYVYYNNGQMDDYLHIVTQSEDVAKLYCESLRNDIFVRYAYYVTETK